MRRRSVSPLRGFSMVNRTYSWGLRPRLFDVVPPGLKNARLRSFDLFDFKSIENGFVALAAFAGGVGVFVVAAGDDYQDVVGGVGLEVDDGGRYFRVRGFAGHLEVLRRFEGRDAPARAEADVPASITGERLGGQGQGIVTLVECDRVFDVNNDVVTIAFVFDCHRCRDPCASAARL